MTEPLEKQKEILDVSIDRRLWAFFCEAGTGKTFMAITTAERWFKAKNVDTVIVVCPKTLIFGTWIKVELPKHSAVPYETWGWRPGANKEHIQDLARKVKRKGKLLYIVINHDGLKSDNFGTIYKFIEKHRSVGWIYDESTAIKNKDTDRFKVASGLAKFAEYKRILTGTPITEGPMDVWAQTEFLQKNILGFSSYYGMKTRYCVLKRRKFGMRSFDEVVGYRDLDDLYRRLSKFSSFLKLTDMVDMPEQVPSRVEVELTKEQFEHYETMRKFAIAWIEENEVTAVNALALLRKLHQIAVGQMRIDDDKYVTIPNNRLETMSDLMKETNHPFIIWSVYRNSTVDLLQHLGKRAIGISVKDNPEIREAKINSWRAGNQQGIVLSPANAAHGLTLIEGMSSVFYSNDFSYERRFQATRRNWRLGQTHKTRLIDLYAPNTVEVNILASLADKHEIADIVTTKKGLTNFIDNIVPLKR